MSVVVRMEMPKWCWDCPCVNGEYGYCQADKEERQIEDPNERPSWCPIITASPWHRVEDDQPDKKKDAIFYYEWTGISGTVYRETSIVSFCELIALGCRPIAWMEMPEPPKEDADGE